MIVLTILITVAVITILWYLVTLTLWVMRTSRMIKNIPGPKTVPIFGNALLFANVKNLDDTTEKLIGLTVDYSHAPDNIFRIWLGPKLLIVLGNPQHIETVLSSEHALSKGTLYEFGKEIVSNGVVVESGTKWAELRKMINPFLTRKAIESNLDIFNKKAMKLLKVLDDKVENDKQFNIKHFISKCTIDMMIVSNYGCDINETENDERPVTLEDAFESAIHGTYQLALQFPTCVSATYAKMTSLGRESIKTSSIFWNMLAKILQDRKNNFKAQNEEKVTLYIDSMIQKAERDKLSWLEAGKIASDYLLAGFHSVTLMSSSAILFLAMYPEYQEAAYQEQVKVLGEDPEIEPTWEQLSNMTYLTRVFKEVTRLLTAPIIGRDVENDIDLGKYTIPKGSIVVASLYSLHRDPSIWSHPLEFYPDHFLPEESAKRPKNTYLPFSWGPRNCPGGIYAMTAFKIILSSLIRKYYFKTDLKFEELTLKYSLFADISQGQLVRKIRRTG